MTLDFDGLFGVSKVKILMIFIDMLGGEYMNLSNPNFPETKLDGLMKKMGGCIYANCYTPAPDTPRSSACMWTGLYPRANGCNVRVKWPKYFLENKVDSIWNAFDRNDYTINVYINRSTEHVGLIPSINGMHIYHDSIYNFMENANTEGKSLNFIYLNDLHRILDNSNYSLEGYIEGNSFCTSMVKELLDYYGDDFFDFVMVYSDHGFRLSGEKREHLLDRDRVKTLMFTRSKGDRKLRIDTMLRSNLDVFPTLCDVCCIDISNSVIGISLYNQGGHDHLLMEDHDKFNSELGITIEHWACIDKNCRWHWLEVSGEWTHDNQNGIVNEEELEKEICHKMSFYDENKKMFYILNELYKLKEANLEANYSNGTKAEFLKPRYVLEDLRPLKNKKILIYGAGKCGKDIYGQINDYGEITIVGWVDIDWHKKNRNGNWLVEGPRALYDREFDCIIIAIIDESLSQHAAEILEQLGVPSNKIICSKPIIRMMNMELEAI